MISKFKLGSDNYLIECADMVISKLVKEKDYLYKAYNYYQGFRDKYLFEHLEKNYGVGNPTSVKFTPLIRKHIDAIVGEYLATRIVPKISCKDKRTLTNILRDKLLELLKQVYDYITRFLDNSIYAAMNKLPQQDLKVQDRIIQRELTELQDQVDREFISNYEIAAQDIVQYIMQSRNMDFKNKLSDLILDMLISGQSYYKVKPTKSKKNFFIEVEDPMNTFVFKNPESRYIKDATMSVVRKWLTREEIAIKYGDHLTASDLKDLKYYNGFTSDDERLTWIAAVNSRGDARTSGILAGIEVSNFYALDYQSDLELIPVYEVEWIDYDASKHKGVLFNVTRIGHEIYILDGENNDLPRSMDDPDSVRITLNGMYYTTRTGIPYSLMLATADLLDLYDLTLFQKDNLIAQSGTKGAIIDVSQLPAWLGSTPQERLIKALGYRKMGASLLDTSQDGNENALNTIYNGFDDTLPVNAIQGYQLSILMIEEMASSITGVFRERLGGIQLRDAVQNVEMGMLLSFIITKLYYQAMDTLVAEMLVDSLNLARKVYKKGFTGEAILGNLKLIFTLLPEHYTMTDYDIHIADSTELIKEMELIKQLALQLAGLNQVDPEILLIVTTSKSMTEMKLAVEKSIQQKKIENNQVQQLQQQLDEANKTMQQMQQQLEQSTKKITQLNERKMAIDEQNNRAQQSIDWFKVKSDADNKEKELELIQERNRLEGLQLLDNNKQNNEIQDKKV